MRLEFRSQSFTIERVLRDRTERRLRFVLGRFSGRISQVTVKLAMLEGQRMSCRIVVAFRRSGKISLDDTDRDVAVVLNRAVDRIGELVRRELDRRREHAQNLRDFANESFGSGS
jgi:ribosome-associated translation inhibitor RaiA